MIGTSGDRLTDRHVFRFDNAGRHDQVANLVEAEGWMAFERPLPLFLAEVAKARPGLVIDVGCNTGFYTLLAARAGSRNHVLAFEPVTEIREIARRNVGLNGLSDQVTFATCALSDHNGAADLYVPLADHGMVETSASLDAGFKQHHSHRVAVAVRRLDRAVVSASCRWRRVSIIKIDVEGHEAEVLNGARWTIRLHRPVVFVEVLQKARIEWLNGFISRLRYVPFRLEAEGMAMRVDRLEHDPSAWNHALIPVERADWFARLASGPA